MNHKAKLRLRAVSIEAIPHAKALISFASERIEEAIEKIETGIDKLLELISKPVVFHGFDEYEAEMLTDMMVALVQSEINKLEEHLENVKRLKEYAEKLDALIDQYKNVLAGDYDAREFYKYYV